MMSADSIKDRINKIICERIIDKTRPYKLPVSDDLLMECNYFDLYPLDGGGGLFSRSFIPTIDDAEYAHYLIEKNALDEFGGLPKIDFARFEKWRTVEKSCWINRCYFIVPLAKRYAVTKDESVARLVVDTIIHFIDTYLPPDGQEAIAKHQDEVYYIRDKEYNMRSFEENQADETDVRYVWFDFQPASRVLHFLYAVNFIKDSPSVSKEELLKICNSIYQHAEVIYYGERALNVLSPGDNHQSLRGLMLLLGGTFFEGVGLWKEFIDEGIRVLNYHSKDGFANDGSLKENSPSYHCFQTWHVRDAYALSLEYGFELEKGTDERLKKHADFVRGITDPGGMTIVVNDGYQVSGSSFLRSLEFVSKKSQESQAMYFPDAGMASVTKDDFFTFLDASVFTGTVSHYHGGKNAITLWCKDKPFLIDSGCCQYDDELFSKWYKLPEAHSSLLVDGTGDGTMCSIYAFDTYANTSCSDWENDKSGTWKVSGSIESSSPTWAGVKWKRELEISDTVTVNDIVESERDNELIFVFNFHPDVEISIDKKIVMIANGDVKLKMDFEFSAELSISKAQGKCYVDFMHKESSRLLVKLNSKGKTKLTTTIVKI